MPTFSAGRTAKVHVNGNDLSQYFKNAGPNATSDTTDVSAFGDTAKVFVATLKDGTFQADGMLQSGTATVDGVLTAALGVDGTELTYFPAGDANGATGMGLAGVDTSHQVSSPVDGVSLVSMELQSVVGVEPVASGFAWAANSATAGTSTVIDNAAATSAGAASYLHAQVVGGTLTVKLQNSSDNISFVDVITHSAVVPGTASERSTVSGALLRYTRYVYTLPAGTATFQASVTRTPKL